MLERTSCSNTQGIVHDAGGLAGHAKRSSNDNGLLSLGEFVEVAGVDVPSIFTG